MYALCASGADDNVLFQLVWWRCLVSACLMTVSYVSSSVDDVLCQLVWWRCLVSACLMTMSACLMSMSCVSLFDDGVLCQLVWWWCLMSIRILFSAARRHVSLGRFRLHLDSAVHRMAVWLGCLTEFDTRALTILITKRRRKRESHSCDTCRLISEEDRRGNEDERIEKADMRKLELLTLGEACKAVLWPTPGFKEEALIASALSTERISVSAEICANSWIWKERQTDRKRENHVSFLMKSKAFVSRSSDWFHLSQSPLWYWLLSVRSLSCGKIEKGNIQLKIGQEVNGNIYCWEFRLHDSTTAKIFFFFFIFLFFFSLF